MATRLASSYREDDLRRLTDARLREAMSMGRQESTAASGERSGRSVWSMLAVIRRLAPRFG
jgi:hypothetical protein